MTRTEAHRMVTKRRQGNGWIVQRYDPEVRAIRESREMPYFEAIEMVRSLRMWLILRDCSK